MRIQSLSLVLAILAGMIATAGPSAAAVVAGNASLQRGRDVLSGAVFTDGYVFTVRNAGAPAGTIEQLEPADSAINWVRIGSDTPGMFAISNGTAEGFDPDIDSEGNARFRGGSIGPGDELNFLVLAQAASVAQDTEAEWIVEVSDNNGQTIVRENAPATDPDGLKTTIRVLKVDTAAVTAPPGVMDGVATAGQKGLHVQTTVSNHGTAPLTVTPSLSGATGDTIQSVTPATATINPGDPAAAFDFVVDVGSTPNRSFSAGASAPGAEAIGNSTTALATEAAAGFNYVNNSLTPKASSSGKSVSFIVSVNKTNQPSVTFDPAGTVLTFTKQTDPTQTFSTTLATGTPTGRGPQTVALSFSAVTIPGPLNAEGLWTPSLAIKGTDDNGADVTNGFSLTNNFEIDNLVPYVFPTIAPNNAGQTNEFGFPVTKDTQQLNIGGTVRTGPNNDTTPDPLDPTATVVVCDLVVLTRANVEVNRIGVPIGPSGCKNTAGTLSGSSAPAALGIADGIVRVDIAAKDAADNTSPVTPSTGVVFVDNIAPTYYDAVTGCGPQGLAANPGCVNNNTVRVFFSEGVKANLIPGDFTVAGAVVRSVTTRYISDYVPPTGVRHADETKPGVSCATPSPTVMNPMPAAPFCNVAILDLVNASNPSQAAIGNDGTPITKFTFSPVPPGRSRPKDGPGTDMADWTTTAIDGIVPALPSLSGVSQTGLDDSGGTVTNYYGKQGDGYYTNQSSPTFRLTGLGAGYTGIVARDANGNGVYDPTSDPDIARCAASAASLDCAATTAVTVNDVTPILVTSLDPGGNLAQAQTGERATLESLVVDQINPTATGYAASAAPRQVSVSFGTLSKDALARGRQFAEDWFVYARINGILKRLSIFSVDGSGNSRELHFDSSETRYTGVADQVKYSFNDKQHPSLRYQDKAGNYLSDFTL
jgi:hypothetical protein